MIDHSLIGLKLHANITTLTSVLPNFCHLAEFCNLDLQPVFVKIIIINKYIRLHKVS